MNNSIVFVTDAAEVTKLAQEIMQHSDAEIVGRGVYLRSLLAGVQLELTGKAVLRPTRAQARDVGSASALAAFEKVQTRYYEAVLAAVPEALTPAEKQSRTAFARSSASTLRRAIGLGWNPLACDLAQVSKVLLREYVDAHTPVRAPTVARIERYIHKQVEKISQMVEVLDDAQATALVKQAIADFQSLMAPIEVPAQRVTGMRLQRTAHAH